MWENMVRYFYMFVQVSHIVFRCFPWPLQELNTVVVGSSSNSDKFKKIEAKFCLCFTCASLCNIINYEPGSFWGLNYILKVTWLKESLKSHLRYWAYWFQYMKLESVGADIVISQLEEEMFFFLSKAKSSTTIFDLIFPILIKYPILGLFSFSYNGFLCLA